MATPTFGISSHSARGTVRSARPDSHRLDVVAVATRDVVQTAGGWLFDRVMAGWQVNVLLPPGCDARPLRVLGAQVLDVAADFPLSGPMSQGLAVSVEAYTADDRVRALVRKALHSQRTEVALWGEDWSLGSLGTVFGMTRTHYKLSVAARAFKGQALRVAGIPCLSIGSTENLLTDSAWLG